MWAFTFIENEDRRVIVKNYQQLQEELLGLLAVVEIYKNKYLSQEVAGLYPVINLISNWKKTLGKEVNKIVQQHPRIEEIERINILVSSANKLLSYHKEGKIKNFPTNKTLLAYLDYLKWRARKTIEGTKIEALVTLYEYAKNLEQDDSRENGREANNRADHERPRATGRRNPFKPKSKKPKSPPGTNQKEWSMGKLQ